MTVATSLDLTSAEVVADPYPFFATARAEAPVQWHDGLGMWLTFTHDAANSVLRTRTLGRIWIPRWPDLPMPAFELIHRNSLLENEPPVHTRLRRLVAGAFARGHVERLRPRVAEMANRRRRRRRCRWLDRRPHRALRRTAAGAGDRRTARRA